MRPPARHLQLVEPALRLSPVSYVVLGLIGIRGPSTPYDLKREANSSIHYFWPFAHSQLYGEPERLAELGLLEEQREAGGRRRKTYSLTPAGRTALRDWLHVAPAAMFEYRDMGLLQLFFSELMSEDELVQLAQKQADLCRTRLLEYEEIAARTDYRWGTDREMATLEFGFRITRAVLQLWKEIAATPTPPSRKQRP
jgi:DNA-binding PadR family transcriptional regulator